MSIKLKQINDEVVNVIPGTKKDMRPVKGANLIRECFANIFLIAKKKSGKTSTIFKLMNSCIGDNTTIVVFCSTLYNDDNWKAIRKYYEENEVPLIAYTSLVEDGIDQLDLLVKHLEEEAKAREAEEKKAKEEKKNKAPKKLQPLAINCEGDSDDDKEKKKKKAKYQTPEYIIVLDDLSSELKHASLRQLLKQNRHYKAKVIISTQWLNDLGPDQRKMINVWCVFPDNPQSRLQMIYDASSLKIPFELFWEVYEDATKEKFNFLYFDTDDLELRKNFNKKYQIDLKAKSI